MKDSKVKERTDKDVFKVPLRLVALGYLVAIVYFFLPILTPSDSYVSTLTSMSGTWDKLVSDYGAPTIAAIFDGLSSFECVRLCNALYEYNAGADVQLLMALDVLSVAPLFFGLLLSMAKRPILSILTVLVAAGGFYLWYNYVDLYISAFDLIGGAVLYLPWVAYAIMLVGNVQLFAKKRSLKRGKAAGDADGE